MEKRTIIAVVLSILLLVLWQYLMPAKPPSPAGGAKPSGQAQNQAAPGQVPEKGPGHRVRKCRGRPSRPMHPYLPSSRSRQN